MLAASGTSGTSDAVDALVVMVVLPGDQLLTSDPADLCTLVTHRAVPVTVVCV